MGKVEHDKNKLPESDMFYGAENYTFKNATENRLKMTQAETILWEVVKNRKLGIKFRRQHPIGKFIADFYCHKVKLVIELDGEYHDDIDQKNYDLERTKEFERLGLNIIRFTNDMVINKLEAVLDGISGFIKQSE